MKILSIILSVMILGNAASAAFIEGLEDFPIPKGLKQIENAELNFGNESIRLVEHYIRSDPLRHDVKINFSYVMDFYEKTLPQLGWKMVNKYSDGIVFERDGEIAEIKKESASPVIVCVTLKSKK